MPPQKFDLIDSPPRSGILANVLSLGASSECAELKLLAPIGRIVPEKAALRVGDTTAISKETLLCTMVGCPKTKKKAALYLAFEFLPP
jgi:hypothetical protein